MAFQRGVAYFILALIMTVCMLVAFGTPVFQQVDDEGPTRSKSTSDIWFTCSRTWQADGSKPIAGCRNNADPQLACTSYKDRVRSIRAFYVLSAVALIPNIAVGVLDMFGATHTPTARVSSKVFLALLSVLVLVLSVLSWAIAISWPRSSFCDATAASESANFEWGASAFMMVVMTIAAMIQLVLALVLPEGSNPNEPTKA